MAAGDVVIAGESLGACGADALEGFTSTIGCAVARNC
jgi:hypothetical protein